MQITDDADIRVVQSGARQIPSRRPVPLAKLRTFSPDGVEFSPMPVHGNRDLSKPGQYFYLQEGVLECAWKPATKPCSNPASDRSGGICRSGGTFSGNCRVVRKIGITARPTPVAVTRRRMLGTAMPEVSQTRVIVGSSTSLLTMFAIADQIHDDRRRKRVAIVEGHAAYSGHRLRVFRVDVENRNRQALTEIGRKARRMQFARHSGEADQIIYDDVDRAADVESFDTGHVQRFGRTWPANAASPCMTIGTTA